MRFLLLCISAVCLVLSVSQCKPRNECNDPTNPECDNYDPCYGVERLSGDFYIYESSFVYDENWRPYSTDTITSGGAIFVAKDNDATYEWKIGSEIITTKSFFRKDFPDDIPVPVTLRVKRNKNFGCFSNGDSTASSSRFLYALRQPEKIRVFGCFQGYNTKNEKDTFTVCITWNDSFSENAKYISVDGLIKDNSECRFGKLFLRNQSQDGFKQLYFFVNTIKCGYFPEALIRTDSVAYNDIYIDFSIQKDDDLNNRRKETFIGYRLQ